MLYDKRWERPQIKDDPFSLESLIAWLEKQPADKTYCYMANGECLLAQYFTAMGFKKVSMGGSEFSHAGSDGKDILLSEEFSDIAWGYPRSFSAALDRAREHSR